MLQVIILEADTAEKLEKKINKWLKKQFGEEGMPSEFKFQPSSRFRARCASE